MELTDYQKGLLKQFEGSTEYKRVGKKTTVCILTTRSGFEIIGTSACVNPADFNEEIGSHYALVNALDKLDEMAGFYRQHTGR